MRSKGSKATNGRFSLRRNSSSMVSNSPRPSSSKPSSSSSRRYPYDVQELREVFHKFDANNDGKISSSELRAIMNSLSENVTEAEIKKMMTAADLDGDGFINVDEFISVNTKGVTPARSMEDLENAFKMFDLDKNGSISAEELFKVLKSLGESTTIDECRQMIKTVDSDADGFVSLKEFKTMMMADLA